MPDATLRPATRADAEPVARIWREGWRDGHLGHVPAALVEVRTPESFAQRAADRVADTTVAVVDGDIAGFTMVTGDEVRTGLRLAVAPRVRDRCTTARRCEAHHRRRGSSGCVAGGRDG